jgi:hypothetical protein
MKDLHTVPLELIELIENLVTRTIAAELERQRKAEDAVWADCFGDGPAAEPKRQRDRVMRFASCRAALSILSGRK